MVINPRMSPINFAHFEFTSEPSRSRQEPQKMKLWQQTSLVGAVTVSIFHLALLSATALEQKEAKQTINSPSKNISLAFSLKDDRLNYSASLKGRAVILPS